MALIELHITPPFRGGGPEDGTYSKASESFYGHPKYG
jgi:hypothetical protein